MVVATDNPHAHEGKLSVVKDVILRPMSQLCVFSGGLKIRDITKFPYLPTE